jgi:hypothetical protein
MINFKKEVTIFKPKKYTSAKGVDYWKFSISDSTFNNETKQWIANGFINVTLFNSNIELVDKQKISIDKVTSVGINEYNGNKSFNIIVELKQSEFESDENGTYEEANIADLPF